MTRTIIALFILAATAFAKDGTFVTRVIHDSDPAFNVLIPSNKFMLITNFIGQTTTQVPGGAVINAGEVIVYQGAAGLPGAVVLESSPTTTTHENHEDVYIAGPAVVYVSPVKGVTLVLTYLRGNN
jgi:hypothetical protein